jgi:hypothetical protein
VELKIDLAPGVSAALEAAAVKALEKAIEKRNDRELFPEWMDLKTGAKYASVAYGTFIKFREMGLPVCEIDGIRRVSKSAINKFLTDYSY